MDRPRVRPRPPRASSPSPSHDCSVEREVLVAAISRHRAAREGHGDHIDEALWAALDYTVAGEE